MNVTAQTQTKLEPTPIFMSAHTNLLQRKCACGGTPGPSGECTECRRKRLSLRRRATNRVESSSVPPIVHEVLRSPGQPLDPSTRAFMEPRFGHDFSQVRVHTDAKAAESARAVNALAYAVGQNTVFAAGQYTPETSVGKRLLAHELAHTVQQQGARGEVQPYTGLDHAAQTLEREADVQAACVMDRRAAEPGQLQTRLGVAKLQRLGDPAQAPAGMSCPIAPNSPLGGGGEMMFGRAVRTLTPSQQAGIAAFVSSWHASGANADVRIDGYASVEGTQAFNWQLSCDRALAVAEEIINPSAPGAGPGIPSSFITIFAQGETAELSPTAPEANRLAVISVSFPAPSPPSTAPAAPPSPIFICGPDVTAELSAAVSVLRSSFAGLTPTQKGEVCDTLDSYPEGTYTWDIIELHNRNWIFRDYRPPCASRGATPLCGETVQVGDPCYFGGSPNYVIFGAMCELCYGHFAGTSNAARYTEGEMVDLIDLYKGTGILGLSTPSGNFAESVQWARVGYHGWPAGGTPPAGDRSNCSPTCPTPFSGPSFRVRWCPHLDPASQCP